MTYLGEGDTPLIKSKYLGTSLGLDNLYFKLENLNPTGSYKDRFAASALIDMQINNCTSCFATSSGNSGSSLAAYCASAGIRCVVAVVDGIPLSKKNQMLAYGAELYEVNNFGICASVTSNTFNLINNISSKPNSSLQISAYKFSPKSMEGVEKISNELDNQMGHVDHIFCPVGGGGLLLSLFKGFEKLSKINKLKYFPKFHAVQPCGNDTIASSVGKNYDGKIIKESETKISGLQVPSIVDGCEVLARLNVHNGLGHLVSDEFTFQIQQILASKEGIFCEPSSAISVSGLIKAVKTNQINPHEKIVCLITGSGFKDTNSFDKMIKSGKYFNLEYFDFAKLTI